MMDKRREAMLKVYTDGPYIYDSLGAFVYAGGRHNMISMVANIRGHGFLTGEGYGALGLSEKEAANIQDMIGRRIALVPTYRELLQTVIDTVDVPAGLKIGIITALNLGEMPEEQEVNP